MNIKLEDRGLVDKADIPDSCQQIMVVYAHKAGFAFALEQAFQDFLRAQDEDTASANVRRHSGMLAAFAEHGARCGVSTNEFAVLLLCIVVACDIVIRCKVKR